ncbi:hypothetical protein GC209_00545 [bacterium]|nr:hypothetical protein [bacterium]
MIGSLKIAFQTGALVSKQVPAAAGPGASAVDDFAAVFDLTTKAAVAEPKDGASAPDYGLPAVPAEPASEIRPGPSQQHRLKWPTIDPRREAVVPQPDNTPDPAGRAQHEFPKSEKYPKADHARPALDSADATRLTDPLLPAPATMPIVVVPQSPEPHDSAPIGSAGLGVALARPAIEGRGAALSSVAAQRFHSEVQSRTPAYWPALTEVSSDPKTLAESIETKPHPMALALPDPAPDSQDLAAPKGDRQGASFLPAPQRVREEAGQKGLATGRGDAPWPSISAEPIVATGTLTPAIHAAVGTSGAAVHDRAVTRSDLAQAVLQPAPGIATDGPASGPDSFVKNRTIRLDLDRGQFPPATTGQEPLAVQMPKAAEAQSSSVPIPANSPARHVNASAPEQPGPFGSVDTGPARGPATDGRSVGTMPKPPSLASPTAIARAIPAPDAERPVSLKLSEAWPHDPGSATSVAETVVQPGPTGLHIPISSDDGQPNSDRKSLSVDVVAGTTATTVVSPVPARSLAAPEPGATSPARPMPLDAPTPDRAEPLSASAPDPVPLPFRTQQQASLPVLGQVQNVASYPADATAIESTAPSAFAVLTPAQALLQFQTMLEGGASLAVPTALPHTRLTEVPRPELEPREPSAAEAVLSPLPATDQPEPQSDMVPGAGFDAALPAFEFAPPAGRPSERPVKGSVPPVDVVRGNLHPENRPAVTAPLPPAQAQPAGAGAPLAKPELAPNAVLNSAAAQYQTEEPNRPLDKRPVELPQSRIHQSGAEHQWMPASKPVAQPAQVQSPVNGVAPHGPLVATPVYWPQAGGPDPWPVSTEASHSLSQFFPAAVREAPLPSGRKPAGKLAADHPAAGLRPPVTSGASEPTQPGKTPAVMQVESSTPNEEADPAQPPQPDLLAATTVGVAPLPPAAAVMRPETDIQTVSLRVGEAIHTNAVVVPDRTAHALAKGFSANLVRAISETGHSRAELILEPAELGRLRFDMVTQGDRVQINLAVERPETLTLMRNHAEDLKQEFRDAGFAGGTLNFSQWGRQDQGKSLPEWTKEAAASEPASPAPALATPVSRRPLAADGLDIRL